MQKRTNTAIKTIDQFITTYSVDVQEILQTLRRTIREIAPEAQEKISYGIPTFTFHGNLVHFSAYEKHIGLYPGAAAVRDFADELKPYDTSKGTIRFPIDKPMPLPLIRKIVKYCVEARTNKIK